MVKEMVGYIQTAKQELKEIREMIENNKNLGYAHPLYQTTKFDVVLWNGLLASLKVMSVRYLVAWW